MWIIGKVILLKVVVAVLLVIDYADARQEYHEGALMAHTIGSGAMNTDHYFHTLGVACENRSPGFYRIMEQANKQCLSTRAPSNTKPLPQGSMEKLCINWKIRQSCNVNHAKDLDDCLQTKQGSDAFRFLGAFVKFVCGDIPDSEGKLTDRFSKYGRSPGVFKCFPKLQDRIVNCVKRDLLSSTQCGHLSTVQDCYGKLYTDRDCNDPETIIYMRDLFSFLSQSLQCSPPSIIIDDRRTSDGLGNIARPRPDWSSPQQTPAPAPPLRDGWGTPKPATAFKSQSPIRNNDWAPFSRFSPSPAWNGWGGRDRDENTQSGWSSRKKAPGWHPISPPVDTNGDGWSKDQDQDRNAGPYRGNGDGYGWGETPTPPPPPYTYGWGPSTPVPPDGGRGWSSRERGSPPRDGWDQRPDDKDGWGKPRPPPHSKVWSQQDDPPSDGWGRDQFRPGPPPPPSGGWSENSRPTTETDGDGWGEYKTPISKNEGWTWTQGEDLTLKTNSWSQEQEYPVGPRPPPLQPQAPGGSWYNDYEEENRYGVPRGRGSPTYEKYYGNQLRGKKINRYYSPDKIRYGESPPAVPKEAAFSQEETRGWDENQFRRNKNDHRFRPSKPKNRAKIPPYTVRYWYAIPTKRKASVEEPENNNSYYDETETTVKPMQVTTDSRGPKGHRGPKRHRVRVRSTTTTTAPKSHPTRSPSPQASNEKFIFISKNVTAASNPNHKHSPRNRGIPTMMVTFRPFTENSNSTNPENENEVSVTTTGRPKVILRKRIRKKFRTTTTTTSTEATPVSANDADADASGSLEYQYQYHY